jgi:hypothetical protein
MSSSMLLHLPDSQLQDSQAGISPRQLRQMHMMMDSEDMSRLTGSCNASHHAEKPSITNNSDLMKAFTTMSTEQQKSLLSNINSKLSNHGGGGSRFSDRRQHCGHSMMEFTSNPVCIPDHHHAIPAHIPPPPVVHGGTRRSSPDHLNGDHYSPVGALTYSRYSKDPNYGSLLGQSVPASQSADPGYDQNLPSSIMVDIDVQGEISFCFSGPTSRHVCTYVSVRAWAPVH